MGPLFAQNYEKLPESAKLTWTFHTVRRGETLGGIARSYRVRLTSLKLANDFSRRTRRIRPGTILMIPVESSYYARTKSRNLPTMASKKLRIDSDESDPSIHVVEEGETLTSIAQDFGTTIATLKRINNLRNSLIKPNMKLYVSSAIKTKRPPAISAKIKIPSPARSSSLVYHNVRRSENLTKIASIYGVTVSDLKNWNNLSSSRLRVGQRLRIVRPTTRNANTSGMLAESTTQESKMVYRVRRGDSLWSIARKFRTTIDKLMKWNETADRDIKPGQRIVIYN